MPTVESSVIVNASLDRVYSTAKDNESFPEFMNDVDSLEILESDGTTIVSKWVGRIPKFGLKVRWTQKDVWDDANHSCVFEQVEGDYDLMEGSWKFSETPEGIQFDSVLEYEYKVPGLGPLVGKIIHGIVVENMQSVLDAIKQRAEQNE